MAKQKKSKNLRRSILKHKALRRAEFNLKQSFERIDFVLDELEPEVAELQQAAGHGVLPEFNVKVLKP